MVFAQQVNSSLIKAVLVPYSAPYFIAAWRCS
jgi:hypothetical protein